MVPIMIQIEHISLKKNSQHPLLKTLKKEKIFLDKAESRMLLIYDGFIQNELDVSIVKKDNKIIACMIVDKNQILNTLLSTRHDVQYQGYFCVFVKKNERNKGIAKHLLTQHMEHFYPHEKPVFSARDGAYELLVKNNIAVNTHDNVLANLQSIAQSVNKPVTKPLVFP